MGWSAAGFGTSTQPLPAAFSFATRISVSVWVTPSCHAIHGAPPTLVSDGASDEVEDRRLIGCEGATLSPTRSHAIPVGASRATWMVLELPCPCTVVSSFHATYG